MLTPGAIAALAVVVTALVCLALEPYLPWLVTWPETLTLPATEWIGAGLTWLLEGIKPVARWFSWCLMAEGYRSAGAGSMARVVEIRRLYVRFCIPPSMPFFHCLSPVNTCRKPSSGP